MSCEPFKATQLRVAKIGLAVPVSELESSLSHPPVALEICAANTILETLGHSRQSGPLHVSICLPAAAAGELDGVRRFVSMLPLRMGTTMCHLRAGTYLLSQLDRLQKVAGPFGDVLPRASALGGSALSFGSRSEPLTIQTMSLRSPQNQFSRSTRHIVLAYAGDSAGACLLMGPAQAQADGKSRSQ